MSTFCRITGRSRGLPKPNYFPLLPPISPADAKRFCRITGKAYGLPTHHFIPVLVGRPKRKSKSHSAPLQRIEGQCLPHGKRHILLSDFRYVSPSFKDAKELNQLLTSKNVECNDKFVYTVDESRCNLVFPAKLEACVRDGDVREIMLAKDLESVLLKLKHGINVSLDIDDIDVSGLVLWEGDGPSEEVIRNRMKRKRTGSTDVVRKIFEDKERAAEVLLEETEKKRPRVKSERAVKNKQAKIEKQAWNNFKEETVSSIVDSNVEKILKVVLAGKDWEQLDKDIDQPQILISSLPTPLNIESDNVDLGLSSPGIIQQPFVNENFIGFEPAVAISPVSPLLSGPDKEILNLIKTMKHEEIFKTAEVDKVFNSTTKSFELLPTITEIPEVMAHLKDGEKAVQEQIVTRNFVNEIHGLKVEIEAGQRFVIGLTIDSPKGPVFIPGQTVNFPIGDTFVPGITVQTPDKQACLLPGLPIKIKDDKDVESEIFVAGQNVMTRDGEKFVQGQTIMTSNGMKFVPGQTVFTGNAPRFIPGQIMPGEKLENYRFIPGQTESTQHEAKFIPGQTVLLPNGATQFIAGQCVEEKDGWDFVPGKSVCRAEGGLKFLPGREIRTQESCVFVPGQYAAGDDGENQFIPGTSLISDYEDLQFILDSNICTPRGEQLVKRISIVPESVNLNKSVPGIIEQPKFMENTVGLETVFHAAHITPNMNEPDPNVLKSIKTLHHDELFKTADIDKVFNLSTKSFEHLPKITDIAEIMENLKNGQKGIQDEVVTRNFVNEVYGLRVETKSGEKFVIGQMIDTPSGQTFVPGRTVNTPNGDTFVPGIIVQTTDNRVCLLPGLPIKTRNEKGVEVENFVAGQNVMTCKGEKFVQGQILLTSEGGKFVAGQTLIIDGVSRFLPGQCLVKNGLEDSRFVPGLTETTHHGTDFIPGQIMAMSNGESEFVPGQSIHSDNGWVFVPGKTVLTAEGVSRFLPGRETKTEDGTSFQPGHYVMADDGSVQFVLGLSVIKSYGDMQFVPTDALNSLKKETKSIIPENINLCHCLPGSIRQPSITGNFASLETAFVPKPITPLMNEPDKNIPNAIRMLHHEELFKTADVDKVFNSSTKSFDLVPTFREIPEVIANLKCGQKSVQEQVLTRNFVNEVHGLRIETKSGQKFVVGLTVDLPDGTAFIPGQTMKTPKGDTFVPGLIVKTLENEASFLPGLPIKVKNSNGDEVDYFVVGQYITTNDSEKFTQGQTLNTNEGVKFVAGQTVIVGDAPHFVPGQILPKLKLEDSRFIPGLTETSQQGEKFIPGQMLKVLSGGVGFVPGQSVNSASGWVFVPGKTVFTEEGGSKFLPGQDMKTKGEFSQQSGHYIVGDDGSTQFLPGMPDIRNYGDMKFVSTVTMNTIVEEQFVEGISVVSEKVNLSQSLPGLVQQPLFTEKFVGFDPILAAKPISPFLAEPDSSVLSTIKTLSHEELFKTAEIEKVFNSTTESFGLLPTIKEIPEIISQLKNGHRAVQEHALTRNFVNEVHGMRVEIDGGKRFVVGQTVETQSGPVFIPGQTVKLPTGDAFVPGISVKTPSNEVSILPGLPIKMKNERNNEVEVFVAGQVATTRDGEKFVQGQTIQTTEGLKFVPGQTVIVGDIPHFVAGQTMLGETLEDSRFIPGQTETTQHGTKFVPGQTVISSGGEVEFIPGQSVCGANGWVFVPGKSVCTIGGGTKFLPGKDIKTEDGVTFVSGQYLTGEDGKVDFIPGTFVMKDQEDIKFLPGASMSTPEGEKFVEGQIVKNKQGDFKFLPGKSSLSESGKLEFTPARKIDEVIFHNKISLGIFSNEYSIYAEMKTNGLYGHMVQTEQGVEFFPGNATGLPAGKVIPGKLIRGEKEGVTFVPGIMLEEDFIPGQLVITDKGEQFIPGQVVETINGPKFVPGQIINSSSGPKFVPGQTVETADGPKFVPGQIVDTKAGPTFIPGQIIFTEEAGSRFVPGQVVDTVEGPHFVPGRVIETGNHVIFIPGQVVETSEGLRFVAPDLEEGEGEGDCEFSVQSFQVTPEELNLLKLQTGSVTPFSGETAIDSKMLRQLSQAGMAIGRQVPAEVPTVDVRTIPAMSAACDLSQRLGLDALSTIKLSQILATIIQFNCDPNIMRTLTCTGEQMELLEKMVQAVVESEFETEMFETLSSLLEKKLKDAPNKIEVLDKLHEFITISDELQNLRKPSVLNIIKEIRKHHPKATEKLNQILSNGGEMFSLAFRHISENRPELIEAVIKTISESTTRVDTETEACDTLHSAIISVVKETSETSVLNMINGTKGADFKKMILQAVGFARALGLDEVAGDLLYVLSDPQSTEALSADKMTWDILRRLTVMKQLAENRPTFTKALHKLESDPELARTDALLRELVRESAALMVVPEEAPALESSADIPLDIFLQANGLAMEDYLMRSRQRGILLIIKDGLQAVVPREASRAVLTGQVPYSVLDEKGIHHFDPLHVFTALRLPKPVKHIFSMYACKIDNDEMENEADVKAIINGIQSNSIPEKSQPQKKEYGGEIISSKDIFVAKHDFVPDDQDGIDLRKGDKVLVLKTERSDSKKPKLDPDLDLGQDEVALLDNAAAKHKMSIRPRRKHADSRHKQTFADMRWLVQIANDPSRQGWVPANLLTLHEDPPENPKEARYRREAVISELVETEEEFGRDIQQVVDHYLKPLDSKSVPTIVRENKELIFGNLKQIAELHNSVLIEGIKYYANEPRMLGKTFIRLERDFDKHVAYCRDEPTAQEFLQENDVVRDFFEEVSQRLGDDKSLSEHLKLPIQRINDYQLLLKELVKYSSILGDDTTDLGKALELMLAVPHRSNDNKFISNIEGYHGNIHKLGRLLKHDWFAVTDRDGKSKDRYLFLFKARILICKVRRIAEERFVFVLKDIIRLPEVEVKDHVDDCKVFELHHKQPGFGAYPLTIAAHKDNIKSSWLTEIREHASDVLALAEHAADDLRLETQSTDHKNLEPLKGIALEPATPDQVLPPVEFNTTKKTAAEEIQKAINDRRNVIEENNKETEQAGVVCAGKRGKQEEDESAGELPSEKKIKTENQDQADEMDRFSSSRRSMSSRRVEEFRSVSSTSSQEIHVETASARHQLTSSTSSSRSMKILEESASINGQTVSQFREVTGDVDGFSTRQEIAAGSRGGESYTAIEEVRSGTRGSKDLTSSRSSVDYSSTDVGRAADYRRSSSTSSVKLFAKPIGGSSPAVGGKAVFECEVEESCRVTWLKDNKPLPEGQSHRFTIVSSENSHRLEITDVNDTDAGIYTARAKNSKGLVSSCTAQLAIDKKVGEEAKQDGSDEHAPFFIVHLKDTQLLENTYLRFMIKVKGNPNPDVKFYKNDKLITSSNARVTIVRDNAEKGFYELVIADVQQEDAGTYKCIASNTHGQVECESVVTVTDEKKLFVGLDDDDKLLAPGETPHFTWLRDGQPFDPEERFKVLFKDEEDSLALVFQHVKPEDAGLYTCVASTSTGKISCSAELTVKGAINQLMREPLKPKIITEIKTQEASIGGSAMLELKIEGYPKPEVMWTKGDEEIKADSRHKFLYEDEESMSLVIKNVQQEDEGDYQVKAVNDLGMDTEVIHLTIKAPPKFKKKLTDADKMVNEQIKLTVQVEGSPKPSVQWYKDGLCIKASDRVKLFEEASAEYTLLIEEARLEDAGSYSVVATNEVNQCSDFCKVEIRSPPKFIKGMEKNIETNENDTVSYTVKVEGDPQPSVKWLHNGSALKSDGKHIKISEDGQTYTLVVSGVGRTDSGTYTCEASNKYATISDSGVLNVRCAPVFRTKMTDRTANEGDTNVEFTVNVDAFPRPNVQWFHDEVEITEKVTEFTRIEEGDNYKLIIKEVTKELSGKYTCKVVNDLGENTTSSNLTVNSKPRFRKGLKNVQVDEGDSLTLEVEIEGVPEPTVKWFKNGEEVTGDAHIKITRDSKRIENYSMTFTLVKPEDGGEYEVRASNEMGTTISQSTVTVHTKTSHVEEEEKEEAPKWTKEEKMEVEEDVVETKKPTEEDIGKAKQADIEEDGPQITCHVMENKEVFESLPTHFEVSVTGHPRPDVKWFKDEKPIEPSDHMVFVEDEKCRLEIQNVKMSDAGTYKCVASNKLGEKSLEAVLSVKPENALRGPTCTTPLKDLKVPKGECAELTAVFTADPEPEITWTHDGHEVDATFVKSKSIKQVENGLVECAFTLQIPAGRHEDTGKYKIEAKNKFGYDESSARLDIILRPEILTFKDATVSPPEGTEMIAVIIANPKPEVSWIFEGKAIKDDSRHTIISDHEKEQYKMELKSASKSDQGVYKVVAKNSEGETSAEAKLKIHTEPPSFVKKIADQEIKEYAQAEFKVRANGVPKPEITWYKNGKELTTGNDGLTIETILEGQVSSTLTIDHFKLDDEGSYTVKAVNMDGEDECSAKLRMAQIAPSFVKGLERSAEVGEGEPLELKAKVDGSPLPHVKWFKDGEEVKDDGNRKISVSPDGTVKLTIDSMKPADSGAYKLEITNPNGKAQSICAVVVSNTPKKPAFIKELADTVAVEGQPLVLQAVMEGFPEPKVKWLKDGHPLRASPNLDFIKTPSGQIGIEIASVKPEDVGQYSVTISNKLGEETSKAKVGVAEKEKKPQFLSHLMPTNVVEGFPAKLEIKISGHPRPELAWFLNGKPIDIDGQHIKLISGPDGSECLLIDRVTPADAGEYKVVAKNAQGETSSKAPLSVSSKMNADEPEGAPGFVKDLRDAIADEGESLHFSAPVYGNPIPDVEWTKDGAIIEPSDRILITFDGNKVGLEINPSKLSDAGSYRCTLRNPLGEADSSAKAVVKKIYQPPQFIQKFTDIQQVPSLDAKFVARISGVPKPEATWFKDGAPLSNDNKFKLKVDDDTYSLYVRDVEPDDAGRYKCLAANREGKATCEADLHVVDKIEKGPRAEPPSFLKRIGDCEYYHGMKVKFTACVTGFPDPDVEWFRGNEKIYESERIRMEKEDTGLLRLIIMIVDPKVDLGRYRCRIFNQHGEDSCEANLVEASLDMKPRKPLGDQYSDFDKYKSSGAPMPLSDRPIISRMSDRKLTLSWKPSIPHGPREPVTYIVEMCELPDGEWFVARRGIRSCVCDIANLEPFRDYKFRIRVENKYGTSDPSPFAITHREKLELALPSFKPYLPPGVDFHPDHSPYFPKDYDIDRPPHDKYAQAPRFLRQEDDTQYGVKNHNCNLFWFVYGYPKPKMEYYFNDELIEMGGRYDCSYTRNGQATLFINKMLERDVGMYEAVATNEHGQARQRVRLQIAEYPQFIQRPDETTILTRKSGKLVARVVGVPYPEIKWFKDWQPLATSSRIKIAFIPPDTCILTINDAMVRDEGLYSISARNIAGAISSSVTVHVEENEAEYNYMSYGKGRDIKPKNRQLGDKYDLGDELGRGTQGITYHAVERINGRSYAAKVMHGKGHLRPMMMNEIEIMNQLNHRKLIRLHDAYETQNTLSLVMELAGGGELLDNLTKQTFVTESEIAGYIRQILWGLEHMHDQNIAHLGLTLGDLLISHVGGDDLKICDFGLSRRIPFGKTAPLEYGMPEYVSPEIVSGQGVGTAADMWSLGIITHILLTGISPFRGSNDRETLTNIRENKWSFREEVWQNLSREARDFVRLLLVFQQEGRMDVHTALRHPWLNRADKMPHDEFRITTDSLRNYYNSYKDWYANASCRTWFRRQPLETAFTHPSRMVYPPGAIFTPGPTPERTSKDKEPRTKTWEEQISSRDPLYYELGLVKSESHYQNGPDTYLLQLRDVDFPVRLREYMKVAANRTPTGLGFTRESLEKQPHLDWRAPVIRERRRFTDVMDEEIDDERKARINKYGSPDMYTLRRLRNELGTRLDTHLEAEAMIESRREGHAPFFREKPQITAIREELPAELSCFAVGDPKPAVQWFKNDMVVAESHRVKIVEDDAGRSVIKFEPALTVDAGIYKAVARNKIGQVVARTRLVVATVPAPPDSPEVSEVSDTEVLLRWKLPRDNGNSPILCYNLQYKEADSLEWTDVASNIDHEFWVIRNLKPSTSHQFRLSARNNIGWSAKGVPTEPCKTKDAGAPKISVTSAMKHYQTACESGKEIDTEEQRIHNLSYEVESSPIEWNDAKPTNKYSFISEIARGQFSFVVKGFNKESEEVVVGKILDCSPENKEKVMQEFEALRSLRHERIACLFEAFLPSDSTGAVFIQEKLQGADILTYLASKHEYTEQMVATAVSQILDALQYLHWRGLCHLDVQPSNIVMASVRSIQVKLVDFGSAQQVSKLGTIVQKTGSLEFTSPEVLCDEPAFPTSDIWSLGVITYILLSGNSPFVGATNEETKQNINFVRYRFEHLYKELTQEATRFLMLIFKRSPSKRPSAEECFEHRWLLPTDYMIKRRERAVFLGMRLKEICEKYHSQNGLKHWDPTSVLGKGPIARSNSIEEELTI